MIQPRVYATKADVVRIRAKWALMKVRKLESVRVDWYYDPYTGDQVKLIRNGCGQERCDNPAHQYPPSVSYFD